MLQVARYWLMRRTTHSLLAVSALGWASVISWPNHIQTSDTCFSTSGIARLNGTTGWEPLLLLNPPAALLFGWSCMVLAMAPLVLGKQVEHVWHCTLARRRLPALALFATGYATIALSVGVLLNVAALVILCLAGGSLSIAVSFAALLAGMWELTDAKRRALVWCHRTAPLAVFGVKFACETVLFGSQSALACLGSCWALMLLALLSGHWHAVAMTLVAALILKERLRPVRRFERLTDSPNGILRLSAHFKSNGFVGVLTRHGFSNRQRP